MKTLLNFLVASSLMITHFTLASGHKSELSIFAQEYFIAWNNTQKPTATKQDLESYLSLLTSDVAWQHLPYQPYDDRKPDGKLNLRKGMTQWLGANTEYSSELINIVIGENLIVLQFEALVKFANSDGKIASRQRNYTDVLELDNGKVSVIRRYGK
jgi:hypothetical protein